MLKENARFKTARLSTPPASSIYNDAKLELESNTYNSPPLRHSSVSRNNSSTGSGTGGTGRSASPSGDRVPRKLTPLPNSSGTPNTRVMADFRRGIYSSPLDAAGTEEHVLTGGAGARGLVAHRRLNGRERVLSAPHGLPSHAADDTKVPSPMARGDRPIAGRGGKTRIVRSSSLGGDARLAPSKQFIYEFPLWNKQAGDNAGSTSGHIGRSSSSSSKSEQHQIRRSSTGTCLLYTSPSPRDRG